MASTIVLVLAIILVFAFSLNCSLTSNVISEQEAGDKIVEYISSIAPSEVEFVDEKSDDSAKSTETTAEEDSSADTDTADTDTADTDTADEDTTVQAEEKSSEDNTEG